MEIRSLKYFTTVADERSFRKAAEQLHISQPGLSQQIAKLERHAGGLLFTRGSHETKLTDLGQLLLPLARRILAETAYADELIQKAAIGLAGTLRLSFVYSAAFSILPRIVSLIQEILPDVNLDFTESITNTQLEKINNGEFDIGIVRGSIHHNTLVTVPLITEQLMLVVHEDSFIAKKKIVHMSELADEPIMLSPRESAMGLYDQIAGLCQKGGFQLNPSLLAVQFPTLVGLVAAKRGVTILPASMSALQVPKVKYLPIQNEGTDSTLSLVVRQDRTNRPGINDLIERLTSG